MQEAEDGDVGLVVDVVRFEEISVELLKVAQGQRGSEKRMSRRAYVEDDGECFEQSLAEVEAVVLELAKRLGVLGHASGERMRGNGWGSRGDVARVEA